MAAAPADLNLLFAVLALQIELVEKDELLAAMNAWGLEKHRPLGDILVERGSLLQEDRQLLDVLIARQLKRHGSAENSLAAASVSSSLKEQIKSLCHPDLAASLARLGVAGDAFATVSSLPSGGGLRYRILRPHAKGGLGEVFVAEDTELHRQVALKQIQTQHTSDDASRGRFLLEAEITGGLEHPGIVPVYGLGSYADGRPFYAMRFIRGDNLKEAITRFHKRRAVSSKSPGHTPDYHSLEFRQLLGRFIDVCNAVAYAHSRGVLHRDLKPGNIMLGKFGETLVVDWGLAKLLGQAESRDRPGGADEAALRPASGSRMAATLAGSAIGTPAYMSPEQAAGRILELGAATDVYSLGATLYTLLTNRPPVEGKDTAELLHKVQRGDIDWHGSGCQTIPRGLTAVCRHAMELNPADRYATPLALAEDLEHWLADEPVSAHPEPMLLRTGRWMRKHRTLVSSAAACLLVATLASVVAAALLADVNGQLDQRNRALDTANGQLEERNKTLADTNGQLDTANAKLNTSIVELDAANANLKTTNAKLELARKEAEAKRLQALNEKQVAQAVRAFLQDKLLRQANPWERANLSRLPNAKSPPAEHDITVRELLHRAAQEFSPDTIGTRFPDQPLVQAEVLETIGETFESLAEHKKAIEFVKSAYLVREKALGPNHPATLASMANLAFVYVTASRQVDAARTSAAALERLEKILATHPAPNHPGKEETLDPAEDATLAILQAIRRRLDLTRFELPTFTFQAQSPIAILEIAGVLPRMKRIADLTKSRYGNSDFRTHFAQLILGFAYHAVGQIPRALEIYEEVHAHADHTLHADDVLLIGLREVLAITYKEKGVHADKVIALEEKICESLKRILGPDHPATVTSICNLGVDYRGAGKADLAVPLFQQSLKIRQAKLGPEHRATLTTMSDLGTVYNETGKPELALPLYQEAFRISQAKAGPYDSHTLIIMHNLATTYWRLKDLDRSVTLLEETLKLRKAKLGPGNPDTLITLAILGGYYRDTGRLTESIACLEEAYEKGRRFAVLQWVPGELLTTYIRAGKKSEASALIAERLREARKKLPQDSPELGNFLSGNARSLLQLHAYSEAEKLLRECLAIHEKTQPDAWTTFNAQSMLGAALSGQKRYADAEPLLLAGHDGINKREATIPPQIKDLRLQEAMSRLAELFEATRKKDERTLQGTLTEMKTTAIHELKLAAGKALVIEMQSNLFNTLIRLEDAGGKLLAENDDIDLAAKNTNSRIWFMPKEDGVGRIIATSFQKQGRGDYEIIIREYHK